MPQGFTDAATFPIALLLVGLAVVPWARTSDSIRVFSSHHSRSFFTSDPESELPLDYYLDPDDPNVPKGLFPTVVNLATNSIITVNATCGETGPEVYCKLVEHGTIREPQCSDCDARSPYTDKRHPIVNAIDGTDSWWQSPSLQNGKKYEWITITLDLKQVYQVTYVIVKAAISPRPGNWILERSVYGDVYKPWQYFAISDSECWEVYGIQPTLGKARYRSDEDVICTSQYSKLNPLENGEIHISLVNDRPGINTSSETLREFTKARFVRLRLQKIRTLHADLMTLNADPARVDRAVTRRYFYSIKDISIGGHCLCFGHAGSCPVDQVTGLHRCQCEHNTCGESCDRCCPLYNQKPWRAGTADNGGVCEKCQCFGHADECFYDPDVARRKASLNIEGKYEGGGVCKDCKHHTTGYNCEQCESGYYRPAGVAKDQERACVKCNCTGPGVSGACIEDDSHIGEGLYPGDCLCKEGYAGKKCENCAPGFRNYPKCEPCPCHYAGTVGGTVCEGECTCKLNVQGERCDKCRPGFYNLAANNPEGCSPCYCFGVTKECNSSDWGIEFIKDKEGWVVTDLFGKRGIVFPFISSQRVLITSEDVSGYKPHENYYWLAPDKYLEKRHHLYGGDVKIVLSYVPARGDSSGTYTRGPDVVLEGNNMLIGYNWRIRKEDDNAPVEFPLREQGWFTVESNGKQGQPVSREDFTMVLYRLTRLLIRAKYHTDQLEGELYTAELEGGSKESNSVKKMVSLEQCHCPPGYHGLSCEFCAPGYRRINNTLIGGICEKCDCNNHAKTCDPYTGKCADCLHHTTGLNCEQCEPGYYGNPRIGLPDDCQHCACPLAIPSNNFSPSCVGITIHDKGPDYICTACPKGYEGDKCERCADGYFGNPLIPGSYCQPCDCGANADTSAPGYCDHLTGQCLKCLGNTGGWKCDECLEGHYGNPQLQDCRPCQCHPEGSSGPQCDAITGQCLCRPNYIGRNCDRCADGFGNIESGCERCGCNPRGSVSSVCDPFTGQCTCKPGVFGTRCDTCLDGYYGFSEQGCHWCGCDSHGSLRPQCNEVTGQCQCKERVIGRTCDRCEPGFWNRASDRGCEPCNCNLTGSLSDQCDDQYGQCNCKQGVGGKHCDQCLPGYYGFSSSGCKKCDPCDRPGHICDPQNGRCVCPANTGGTSCQRCAPGAWGYDPVFGCKLCNCNKEGSKTQECNEVNGECQCFEGYGGRQCNKCHFGYYNFPNCRRCNCHPDGTIASECRADGQCQCDESGQCPCKANVDGLRCDRCKAETFGLSVTNPKGCFNCFCFGKTNKCDQSKMVWLKQTIPNREANFELGNTRLESFHGLLLIPGDKDNVRVGVQYVTDQPLYWSLPSEFKGDKVQAYNGRLQFRLESIGTSHFPQAMLKLFPLVVIKGNHRIILEHFASAPSEDGYYRVQFHESEWKHRDNPQFPVTQKMMMVALQRVQQLLIRATDGADAKGSRLRDVSMEVAAPHSSIGTSPHYAYGVEFCRCPHQYAGTSCQDPAPGFYRKFKPGYKDSREILDLVGWAEPCPCNNRSRTCDPETGVCKDCTQFTTGPYCNLCEQGFYGDPARGPCLPCLCPSSTRSFSDTCEARGTEYICTNCQKGYAGRHCERCDDGYYGNPLSEVGICKPCGCSPHGSRSNVCDKNTGQCPCVEGITGRDCSTCLARHILTEYGCKSCDDDCTGELLNEMDFLQIMIEEINIPNNISLLLWIRLLNADDHMAFLEKNLEKYKDLIADGRKILYDLSSEFDLAAKADILYSQAQNLSSTAPRVAFEAEDVYHEAEQALREIKDLRLLVRDVVNRLKGFGVDPHHPFLVLDQVVREAEKILKELQFRNFGQQEDEAKRELRKAIQLLDRVLQMTMDPHYAEDLKGRLKRLQDAVGETVNRILHEIQKPTEEALRLNEKNGHIRKDLLYTLEDLKEIEKETVATLKEARELINQIKSALVATSVGFSEMSRHANDLRNLTEQLEYRRGILSRLNPEYREKYVVPLERHALQLMEQANHLKSLFNATEVAAEAPLRAAEAYKRIIDALAAAEEAARRANEAAQSAYDEVFPRTGDAVTLQATKAKEYSDHLLNEAMKLKNKLPEIQKELRHKNRALDRIADEVGEGQRNLDLINQALDRLPKGITHGLEDTKEVIQGIHYRLNGTHQKIDGLNDQIGQLKSKVDGLRAGSAAGLENLTKIIEQARADIKKSSALADSAEKRADRVTKKHNELQLNLKELKDKILLARQKASSIKVSLSANKQGHCIRSYKPEIEPTTTNHIILNYAIKEEAKNSLLFFIISNTSSDFMAIEMVDRKIHFLWNAGGGTKMIEHSRTIETNDPSFSKDEQWFKIEVNRIGRTATLSVLSMKETEKGDQYEVTGVTDTHFSKMDLDSTSSFYVGGIPSGVNAPKELKTRSSRFAGCLYEVTLDDRPVGLWNFLTSSGCGACKEGAAEQADPSTFQFFGEGYAILPQIRYYNKKNYAIVLSFKSLDEDALLFFCGNRKTGAFVSLELHGGYVVYQFNLSFESRLVLTSKRKHNTGDWIRVVAVKEGLEGHLQIKDDYSEGKISRSKTVTLDLKDSNLYFGGVPPNFSTTVWPSNNFNHFFGCMKDFQIDSTPLGLTRSKNFGIRPGCKDGPVRSVSFKGTGYLEMSGHPLEESGSFSFSFSTTQSHTLLVLSTFKGIRKTETLGSERLDQFRRGLDDKADHYYSVSLINGFVEAKLNGGHGEARIVSEIKVNDGKFHTLAIIKQHRKITMSINDVEMGGARLPKGTKNIDAPSDGGLFFGGIPNGITIESMATSKESFKGVIKDAVFNNKLLDFYNPVEFEGVGIGRSKQEIQTDVLRSTLLAQPIEQCAEMTQHTHETGGVKFGDALHSHVRLDFEGHQHLNKNNFSISLNFRTYYPNGLIALAKGKRKTHFTITLIGGKLIVEIKGRKKTEMISQGGLNDGQWHNVSIIKQNKHMWLSVDDRINVAKAVKIRKKLPIKPPLYVGGIPETLEVEEKMVTESFKGCIRNFQINKKLIDLASGPRSTIRQCFTSIEPGAYFAGDSYAIYAKEFNLGLKLDMQLDFKTIRLNGVLLSLSDPSSAPSLSLELKNGQVVASADNNDGLGPFRASTSFSSKYDMCDGKWHSVSLYYNQNELTLKVDAHNPVYGLRENIPNDVETANPLYIGGLPEHAPSGSLQIRDNFVGCLRNVAINDQRMDWVDMAHLQNVLPNSCPTF